MLNEDNISVCTLHDLPLTAGGSCKGITKWYQVNSEHLAVKPGHILPIDILLYSPSQSVLPPPPLLQRISGVVTPTLPSEWIKEPESCTRICPLRQVPSAWEHQWAHQPNYSNLCQKKAALLESLLDQVSCRYDFLVQCGLPFLRISLPLVYVMNKHH